MSISCDGQWMSKLSEEMFQELDLDVQTTRESFDNIVKEEGGEARTSASRYLAAVVDIMLADWLELCVSEVVGSVNTHQFLSVCVSL